MLRWHERREQWQHPEDRALTPAEMFGVVLREAKRRRLPWWKARQLAIKALPWCPESRSQPPANEEAFAALLDWYEALIWAMPALKAAYLDRYAPQITSDDVEPYDFDAAAFSEFVEQSDERAAVERAAVMTTAGEWAPEGLDLD